MMNARAGASVIALAVLLTSCGPTSEQIQTAISQTQVSMPTATAEPTATPKLVTGADLEFLLYQTGDLPSEYHPEQFNSDPPPYWREPVLYRRLGVSGGGSEQGFGVEVGEYSEAIDPDVFRDIMGASGESVDGLGDESRLSRFPHNIAHIKLVWRRCSYAASIDIMFDYTGDDRPAITYARRLDERLAEVLCP